MTKTVEFWFDYGSGPSHIAYWALKDVAKRTATTIALRPMLLGAVFQATGNRTPLDIAAKARWMIWDLENHARKHGVPFKMNPHVVFNTLPLMRGALVAQRRRELERFSDVVFNAIWVQGRNLGDAAVIRETLAEHGFDVAAYLAGVQEQDIKDELKRRSDEAVAKGVFGAPSFFVGPSMWWGQDRLEWVEAALSEAG